MTADPEMLLKPQKNESVTTAASRGGSSATGVVPSKSWPNSRRTSPDISSIWGQPLEEDTDESQDQSHLDKV